MKAEGGGFLEEGQGGGGGGRVGEGGVLGRDFVPSSENGGAARWAGPGWLAGPAESREVLKKRKQTKIK